MKRRRRLEDYRLRAPDPQPPNGLKTRMFAVRDRFVEAGNMHWMKALSGECQTVAASSVELVRAMHRPSPMPERLRAAVEAAERAASKILQ